MKKKLMIPGLAIAILIACSCILLMFKKPNIDSVALKLVKLNPSATIEKNEPKGDITKPNRVIWVNIGAEKIYLYEYKDKESAQYGLTVYSSSGVVCNVADSKNNILVFYKGENEDIIKQFDDLLD